MKKISLILILFLCIIFYHGIIINEQSLLAEDFETAIGFSAGFGGTGLSYKNLFAPDKGIQLTGFVIGDSSEEFSYNLGFVYNKVLHASENNRLFLLPGISWTQTIDLNEENDVVENEYYLPPDYDVSETVYYYRNKDYQKISLGFCFGIEFRQIKFENVALTLMAGYDFSYSIRYFDEYGDNYWKRYDSKEDALNAELLKSFRLGPTGGISLFYYF